MMIDRTESEWKAKKNDKNAKTIHMSRNGIKTVLLLIIAFNDFIFPRLTILLYVSADA